MKNLLYIFLSAFLALNLVACQDEIMQNTGYEPAEVGTEVLFGSRAGFESGNPDTRTVYGQVYNGTVGGNTVQFQHIAWIPEDDHILIYSPQAANPYGEDEVTRHNVTYQVADSDMESSQVSDFAYLKKEESQVGALHWSSTEAHDFYAIYPSPDMFMADYQNNPGSVTSADGMKFVKDGDKVWIEALLPADQSPGSSNITKDTDGNWTVAPDMRYAFMVAKETATTQDGGVDLTFYPMVTAVEITLEFPDNEDGETQEAKQISDIWVAGDGENPIVGRFSSVDLNSEWDGTSYVKCTPNADANARVHLNLRQTAEGNGILKLDEGKSITFTVFLLPGQYGQVLAKSLKVSFSESGVGEMAKTLTDAGIKANIKTRINGLELPKGKFEVKADRWMAQIPSPEKAKISALSIPGAGGAFTRTASADYVQQTLDLEGLWKVGVRAFEFSCKRSFNEGEGNSLYDQPVRVGSSSGNGYTNAMDANGKVITVGSVMTNLLDKVISTETETAVVIISYQSEGNDNDGNDYSNNRCSEAFAKELAQMYSDFQEEDDYAGRIIQYTPDLTLAQARGKVILIARINQHGEEEPSYANRDGYYNRVDKSVGQAIDNYSNSEDIIAEVSDADEDPLTGITLIHGCGTGKDRWGRRGYKVNGKPVNDYGDNVTETGNTEFMEKYMENEYLSFTDNGNGVYTATSGNNTITRGEPDFAYDTNNADGKQCWYQDWARVVKSQVRYRQRFIFTTTDRFYWFESFNEKVEHVCLTYDKSIADTDRTYTYINSLSGYYPVEGSSECVIPLWPSHNGTGWWGGASSGGNIAGLAADLNKAFYDHVVAKINAGASGPTGIVLIDRITATAGDPAYELMGLILSNNNEFYEE